MRLVRPLLIILVVVLLVVVLSIASANLVHLVMEMFLLLLFNET
jgi:hypothetical protein